MGKKKGAGVPHGGSKGISARNMPGIGKHQKKEMPTPRPAKKGPTYTAKQPTQVMLKREDAKSKMCVPNFVSHSRRHGVLSEETLMQYASAGVWTCVSSKFND